MAQTKVILFNGPPRSGKDTAATMAMLAAERYSNVIFYRFAQPLKDAVHAMFGMPGLLTEHFDSVKGEPCERMMGMTPRQAYIDVSEKMVKPIFGKDFWSKIAVMKIKSEINPNWENNVVVISDCGFQEEVDVLIEAFGIENASVVHLYRYECDFNNDSRSYVTTDFKEHQYAIWNSGTKEDLQKEVTKIVGSIIHGTARE